MDPDEPREGIAARYVALADLIESALPRHVESTLLPDREQVLGLLLARIADQARSQATLMVARHDLEGQMVTRSIYDHAALFAWLATDRPFLNPRGRGPEDGDGRVRWWLADQLRREEHFISHADSRFGGFLNDATRAALRSYKRTFKDELTWGGTPSLEEMVLDVDAHWASRLPGWREATMGTQAFAGTFAGMYSAVYKSGNHSIHPTLGLLLPAFRHPLVYFGGAKSKIGPPKRGGRANLMAATGAFILLHAVAVAEAVNGAPTLDAGLKIMDRFVAVRAVPGDVSSRTPDPT